MLIGQCRCPWDRITAAQFRSHATEAERRCRVSNRTPWPETVPLTISTQQCPWPTTHGYCSCTCQLRLTTPCKAAHDYPCILRTTNPVLISEPQSFCIRWLFESVSNTHSTSPHCKATLSIYQSNFNVRSSPVCHVCSGDGHVRNRK